MRGAGHVSPFDVLDLEAGGVTVAGLALEGGALRDGEGDADVDEGEVLEVDVGGVAEAAAAAVGGEAFLDAAKGGVC